MSVLPTLSDYKVTSVTKSDTPSQTRGKDWYQYEISNEVSTITGQRLGTQKQVQQHAQDYSEQLNERLHSGGSYYRPKKPDAAKKSN
ncbi:MAG: hypothetical protein HUJ29_04425 [Gammaproteobacteria bacterium]|nr:hypothetical protein [Gammaproteobacteria bacterium]